MRLALLIYGPLDTLSGGYLYDRKLVEYLRGEGDQVEVISLPWRNYVRHLGDNLSTCLLRKLVDLQADILMQDELNHPSLFWLNRRLRPLSDVRLISIVHHLRSSEPRPAWLNLFYRWIEHLYLQSLDGFIFNSDTTRQVVGGLLRTGRPHVVAHPAGDRLDPQITDQEIRERSLQPGPLRLFFLGNLIPRKGLHILISALEQLPRDGWQLAVAGGLSFDGAYTERILRMVRANGLSDSIEFLGPLNKGQLSGHLRESHLLVLPSFYEGFGIAYLEGMGFGLPALATSAGAAGEIITPDRNGFLIPPGDSDTLAGSLRRVILDRRFLLEMSLNARQRYLDHPTWEQTTRKIREFLLEQTNART